eukprot:11158945-Lingulodinium_polyedra.AAC.1
MQCILSPPCVVLSVSPHCPYCLNAVSRLCHLCASLSAPQYHVPACVSATNKPSLIHNYDLARGQPQPHRGGPSSPRLA